MLVSWAVIGIVAVATMAVTGLISNARLTHNQEQLVDRALPLEAGNRGLNAIMVEMLARQAAVRAARSLTEMRQAGDRQAMEEQFARYRNRVQSLLGDVDGAGKVMQQMEEQYSRLIKADDILAKETEAIMIARVRIATQTADLDEEVETIQAAAEDLIDTIRGSAENGASQNIRRDDYEELSAIANTVRIGAVSLANLARTMMLVNKGTSLLSIREGALEQNLQSVQGAVNDLKTGLGSSPEWLEFVYQMEESFNNILVLLVEDEEDSLFVHRQEVLAHEKSLDHALSESRDAVHAMIASLEEVSRVAEQMGQTIASRSTEVAATSRFTMLGVAGVVAIVMLVLGAVITRRITGPLTRVIEVMRELAAGKLDRRIDAGRNDEIGQVMSAAQAMVAKLIEVIRTIKRSTTALKTGTREISAGNSNLSDRTESQASSLEETASSMEEMTSTVKQNADNASQANQLAALARQKAELGGEVVSRAVDAMSQINAGSKRIADIIGVIDEIAFQTNLLALNAAVEAARAGEQGRGFAVVAGEVRSLASRSAEAAKEIKVLIQDSVSKVDEGSRLVDESGKSLEEILEAVKKVSDIVAEITAASYEQSSGIEQVNKAVMNMDGVTQQNAALVEEASAASHSLDQQATELARLIEFFTVADDGAEPPLPGDQPQEDTQQSTDTSTTPERRGANRPWAEQDVSSARTGTESRTTAAATKPRQAVGAEDAGDWEEF